MDDEAFMSRISEAQFAPYTKEYDELAVVLETCNQNASAAQAKIDEQTAELTMLRDTTSSTTRSLEEITSHKKTIQAAIEAGARKMSVLREQEKQNRSRVNELYGAIDDLKLKLQGGSGWSEEQEQQKQEVIEKIENLNRSLESKNTLSSGLRSDIAKLQVLVEQGEFDVEKESTRIKELNTQAEAKREEAALEQRAKMALEQRLQKLQLDMEEQVAVLIERESRARVEEASIVETEAQLRESKKEMERYLKDYEKLFQETQRLTEQLESLMYSNETTENENEVRRRDVSVRERNVNTLKSESSQLNKAKDVVLKKLAAAEKQRETWEQEREELRSRIAQLSTLEIRSAWREGEGFKKQLEDLAREREILSRKLGSSEKTAQLIFDLTKVNQNAKKNLQNEVNGYTATVKLQREQIESLVQDRERHEQEANAASRKYYVALEQLKLQEVQISDLQRKIIDGGARLKQQQNLYEAVRSDRNLYSKNLIQSQEEIAEMKRRFKIMNHQIEQLKEEITVKDHSLVKEHFNHHNVDKERESLKNELTKIRKQIVSSEQIISNQRAEIQKLSQIIREADEERQRQHKEHDAIVGERNILSSQLIRRNEELATVYEKMKINWSSLQRGETRFAECAAEVQFLVERIQEMRRERDDSALQMSSIHDLRYTLHALESDLLQERNKIKALQEELERPLNVHRWRMLESSDPQRFEMIKKIQGLQKRIIQKTEDVFEKEARIQEKERLYIELKNVLGRQPGPEVAEQLALYESSLREKNVQMKAMTAELDMYKQQVAEFRGDIDGLAHDLDTLKEKWLHARLSGGHVPDNDRGAKQ